MYIYNLYDTAKTSTPNIFRAQNVQGCMAVAETSVAETFVAETSYNRLYKWIRGGGVTFLLDRLWLRRPNIHAIYLYSVGLYCHWFEPLGVKSPSL